MKIAILTFYYGSENYGAVLQAYALNKYLSNRFPDTEVHTMSYSMSENNASQFFFHELKNYLSNFLHGRFSYDIRKFKFAQFRKKIPHTKFCNPETVSKIAKDYDIIIAGSDQIWNPHFCNDRNYFLPFDCKTISYAASVGESNLTEGQLEAIKAGLAELDYISVREKADEILFSKETDRCITTVLDPTLLLRKEDYIQLFGKQHNDVPYTVFYILGNLDRYTEIIARVVRGGSRVKIISASHVRSEQRIKNNYVEYLEGCGPTDFVQAISMADFVYTDSFHATVFSLLFERQFYTFPKGMMNARIETLLNIFNLTDRFISIEEFMKRSTEPEINYRKLKNQYLAEKHKSENWLYNAICGSEGE